MVHYHERIDCGDSDFCDSVPKEEPEECVKGNNKETVNCHSHNLQCGIEVLADGYLSISINITNTEIVKK